MKHKAIKSELIEWLTKLEDEETIDYLKRMKDANDSQDDWGQDLTEEQKSGIENGLKDVDDGRVIAHDIIKGKYGL